ncbi:MAG TPA: hypothetical protein VFS76_18005 [Pyrinomonadaceae bacterium]|nr:hypothetical protein [Pyrinomonadaceae bacterium]
MKNKRTAPVSNAVRGSSNLRNVSVSWCEADVARLPPRRHVKATAAEEAMRIVAEKKRGEVKFQNASRDIANFVHNADLMEERKKDYQMTGEFESASGVTKIQVGRNWTNTVIAGTIAAILLILIVRYAFKNVL